MDAEIKEIGFRKGMEIFKLVLAVLTAWFTIYTFFRQQRQHFDQQKLDQELRVRQDLVRLQASLSQKDASNLTKKFALKEMALLGSRAATYMIDVVIDSDTKTTVQDATIQELINIAREEQDGTGLFKKAMNRNPIATGDPGRVVAKAYLRLLSDLLTEAKKSDPKISASKAEAARFLSDLKEHVNQSADLKQHDILGDLEKLENMVGAWP
ncbi:MAG: hypothetical protein QNK37_08715 [Acidobacteriota bacterium]|nr:hypothetical protein [Acidobacteriota bacterium]